jgi:hypothetical protein
MVVANVSIRINDGSVVDGRIGDGSIFIGDKALASTASTIIVRASLVNPATATVGLGAAAGISSCGGVRVTPIRLA